MEFLGAKPPPDQLRSNIGFGEDLWSLTPLYPLTPISTPTPRYQRLKKHSKSGGGDRRSPLQFFLKREVGEDPPAVPPKVFFNVRIN